MLKKLPVIATVALVLCAFTGRASAAMLKNSMPVTLTDNGEKRKVATMVDTVGEFLDEMGVSLNEEDELNYSPEDKILGNMHIVIERPFSIEVCVDGEYSEMFIKEGTKVGNVAVALKADSGINYTYDYSPAQEVSENELLEFSSYIEEEFSVTDEIEFETEIIEMPNWEEGAEEVVSEGEVGEKETIYHVVYTKGEETLREIISEEVIKEPVKRVVNVGTGEALAAVGSEVFEYKDVLVMSATAYSAGYECTGKNPGDKHYGITASGEPVRHGIVAVDPRVIPLGTELYIEGYGYALAADTGGAIKGMKIDLYYDDMHTVRQFGRKSINVYVLP